MVSKFPTAIKIENLVTHRSQNFWLLRDCPYAKSHTLKNKSSAITIGTSLILDFHVMINSHDHIAGSSQELMFFRS